MAAALTSIIKHFGWQGTSVSAARVMKQDQNPVNETLDTMDEDYLRRDLGSPVGCGAPRASTEPRQPGGGGEHLRDRNSRPRWNLI